MMPKVRTGFGVVLLVVGLALLPAPRNVFGYERNGPGGGNPPPDPCPHELPGQGQKDCKTFVNCNDAASKQECLGEHWSITNFPLKCVQDRPNTDGMLCDEFSEICERETTCVWNLSPPLQCTGGTSPHPGRIRRAPKLVPGWCVVPDPNDDQPPMP